MEPGEGKRNVAPWVLGLVGGALLSAGPFLPWMTAGMLSVDGFQKTDGEAWIVVGAGMMAAIIGLMALTSTKRPGALYVAGMFIAGMVGAGLTGWYFWQLYMQTQGRGPFHPQLGIGLYACAAGAVVTMIGAFLSEGKERA